MGVPPVCDDETKDGTEEGSAAHGCGELQSQAPLNLKLDDPTTGSPE